MQFPGTPVSGRRQYDGNRMRIRIMNGTYNRKFLLTALIISVSLFFVVLGMRNPYLNDNHGPKQRPRAVIEKTTKTLTTIVQSQHIDIERCQKFALPASFFRITSTAQVTPLLSATVITKLVARGPPTFSSLLKT